MMGDNRPLKELPTDTVYSNTHFNSRETVPLSHRFAKKMKFRKLVTPFFNLISISKHLFFKGLASDNYRDWGPATSTLGGCGEDSLPGAPARPHGLPATHTAPLPPSRQEAPPTNMASILNAVAILESRYPWGACLPIKLYFDDLFIPKRTRPRLTNSKCTREVPIAGLSVKGYFIPL